MQRSYVTRGGHTYYSRTYYYHGPYRTGVYRGYYYGGRQYYGYYPDPSTIPAFTAGPITPGRRPVSGVLGRGAGEDLPGTVSTAAGSRLIRSILRRRSG